MTSLHADIPGFGHHMVDLGDVRLHYVRGGVGEPLFLVHGFPTTWFEWRHVMPTLAESYDVIVPDLRGLGDSSKPYAGYDKQTLGEDLSRLMDRLGLPSANVVGHDWGASAAFALARTHPVKVKRLAILEHALPGFGLEELLVATQDRVLWHMTFQMSDVAEMLVTGRERQYLMWFYTHIAYNPYAVTTEEVDEYVRAYSMPGAMRSGFNLYRTFFDDVAYNRAHAASRLRMPVLTLGGDSCLGDLSERGLRQVAENVRGSVVKDCGHWIPQERPDLLLDELGRFLKEPA